MLIGRLNITCTSLSKSPITYSTCKSYKKYASILKCNFYIKSVYSVETSVVINVLSCTELQMHMVRLNVSVSNTFRLHLVRDSTAFYDISLCFILDAWWWRHQMETSSALLALCAGTSPVTGEFPSQRPVARSFDVFFALRRNKLFSKQSWRWWFETPSRSL